MLSKAGMAQSNLLNSINWIHLCISISWKHICYDTIQTNWERAFPYDTFLLNMEDSSEDEIHMMAVAAAASIIHSAQNKI